MHQCDWLQRNHKLPADLRAAICANLRWWFHWLLWNHRHYSTEPMPIVVRILATAADQLPRLRREYSRPLRTGSATSLHTPLDHISNIRLATAALSFHLRSSRLPVDASARPYHFESAAFSALRRGGVQYRAEARASPSHHTAGHRTLLCRRKCHRHETIHCQNISFGE